MFVVMLTDLAKNLKMKSPAGASLTEKIKRKSKKRVWSQPDVELVSPDLSDIQEANVARSKYLSVSMKKT